MTKLTEHRVYLDKEEKLDQFQLHLNQVFNIIYHQFSILLYRFIFLYSKLMSPLQIKF